MYIFYKRTVVMDLKEQNESRIDTIEIEFIE